MWDCNCKLNEPSNHEINFKGKLNYNLFHLFLYISSFYVTVSFILQEDLRQETRRRNLLILMLSHLTENGYLETASCLEKEGNISLNRWQVG